MAAKCALDPAQVIPGKCHCPSSECETCLFTSLEPMGKILCWIMQCSGVDDRCPGDEDCEILQSVRIQLSHGRERKPVPVV